MPLSVGTSPNEILVEGSNDEHVIRNLCKVHALSANFRVRVPDHGGGIDKLLAVLPVVLKSSDLRALAIVVDADQDVQARWDALRSRLHKGGYHSAPAHLVPDGWISSEEELFKVGAWIMPDNSSTGMLEDFVTHLVPENDPLLPEATSVLQNLEGRGLNRYPILHHPKALIHTWLSWQEKPGMPMGLAITARVLDHDQTIANDFVQWIQRLFGA